MNPDVPKIAEQPTADDIEEADKRLSREEIRLTENRLMTLGLGPENFTENEGFNSFDEGKEGDSLRKKISEMDDVGLGILVVSLTRYQKYLSSQPGRLALLTGATPDVIDDGASNLGGSERLAFMIKVVDEEEKKRKIGFWKKFRLMPEGVERHFGLKKEIENDRDNRDNREARDALKSGSIQSIIGHVRAFREEERREEEEK